MELAIFSLTVIWHRHILALSSLLFWDFGLHVTSHFWAELEGRHRMVIPWLPRFWLA